METSLQSPLSVTSLEAFQGCLSPKFFVQHLDHFLVVDLRCSQLYNVGHIRGARCLPLKKKKFLNSQLSELYLHNCLRKLFKFAEERVARKQACQVVLYDHSSTETTVWNPIWKLHNRCQEQRLEDLCFFVLNGGFSLFSCLYPKFVVSCKVVDCSKRIPTLTSTFCCSVFQDSLPCKIFSFIYLGNERNASDRDTLDLLGITHILVVGEELESRFPGIYEYKQLMIRDLETQDLLPFLGEAVAFIEQAKNSGKVLVHCYAGVSRSAAIVLAYLIYLGNTFDEAWELLVSRKSDVQPLGSFVRQLREYEMQQWNNLRDVV